MSIFVSDHSRQLAGSNRTGFAMPVVIGTTSASAAKSGGVRASHAARGELHVGDARARRAVCARREDARRRHATVRYAEGMERFQSFGQAYGPPDSVQFFDGPVAGDSIVEGFHGERKE